MASPEKIDLRVLSGEMRKIGNAMVLKANEDALDGIMQDGQKNLIYRSKQYIRYKANAMRRFTKNVTMKTKETQYGSGLFKVTRKAGRKKLSPVAMNISTKSNLTNGGKLKGYEGRSINTDVSKVNLHLTGDMFRSLKVVTAAVNHCRVSFGQEEAGKVIGNKNHGYNAVGLNEENKQIVKQMIIMQLEANKNKIRGNYKL